MASIETSIASGRVATSLKKRVDDKIRRRGLSPSDIVSRAYNYIDTHDDIPWMEDTKPSGRSDAFDQFNQLVSTMPVDTPLDALTPSELKKELANRD